MPANPFAESLSVRVSGDASGAITSLQNLQSSLALTRTKVGLLGGALGALGAGGLLVATDAAADFEEQMVEVEKVTDPETAEAMSGAIQEMAGEMPVAQSELAGIAATAGRLGIEGTDNLNTFTRVTAEMATATDLTAQEAADSFARMSTLMEEPIENSRGLGNAINELSNTMAASSSEITNSATRSAGVLNQLGLESDQILGLNAAMNEVSATSRIAGTQLRRFAQEIQDPRKVTDLANALNMTEQEFRNMRESDPAALMERMVRAFQEGDQSAEALRGTLGTTSRQTLAKLAQNWESVESGISTANYQMARGESLAEEFEAASSTFNAEVRILTHRLRNLAITTGAQLLPVASSLLGVANALVGGFMDLNERTDGMAGTFILVAGAVGGLATAVVALTPVIAGLAAAFSILLGPIGLVVLAIAALSAAWSSNFLGIQDITEDVINGITGFLSNWGPKVLGFFGDLWEDVKNIFRDFEQWVIGGSFIPELFGRIVSYVAGAGANAVGNAFSTVKDKITGAFEDAKEAVIGNSTVPALFAETSMFAAGPGAKAMAASFQRAGSAARSGFTNEINKVPNDVSDILDNLGISTEMDMGGGGGGDGGGPGPDAGQTTPAGTTNPFRMADQDTGGLRESPGRRFMEDFFGIEREETVSELVGNVGASIPDAAPAWLTTEGDVVPRNVDQSTDQSVNVGGDVIVRAENPQQFVNELRSAGFRA